MSATPPPSKLPPLPEHANPAATRDDERSASHTRPIAASAEGRDRASWAAGSAVPVEPSSQPSLEPPPRKSETLIGGIAPPPVTRASQPQMQLSALMPEPLVEHSSQPKMRISALLPEPPPADYSSQPQMRISALLPEPPVDPTSRPRMMPPPVPPARASWGPSIVAEPTPPPGDRASWGSSIVAEPTPPPGDRASWGGPVAPAMERPSFGGGIGAFSRVPPSAPSQDRAVGDAYAPGDVIAGKYRLMRVIGRGGMGAVWLASNLTLDIEVAIKLIRRDRAAPAAAMRLLQEARAAARLNHPSIVRVFEFGESQHGDPFIVMELLQGESLDAILVRKGRLPAPTAAQTLLPVASALIEAHGKGVVHRDLKPDNIFLVTDDSGALTPKVVDFGIAKLMHGETDRSVTMAGEVLGSPDYMSPEQARGEDHVGEGTDVWAFSVVLYEAITGRRPFDGPNYNALIASILTNSPVPTTDLGAGDAALWAIIERGLAKEIPARWPTMRALGMALAAWATDHGVEDDVTGAPIVRQWLAGRTRRLITVNPDAELQKQLHALARPTPEPPHSAPARASDRTSDRGSGASGMSSGSLEDWSTASFQPSRARRFLAPVLLLATLAGAVVLGLMLTSASSEGTALQATQAGTISAVASVVPRLVAAAAPSASVAPAPSSSVAAKPLPTVKAPRRPEAPKVPKHINF